MSHILPSQHVLPHQIGIDWSHARQCLRVSATIRRIQDQPTARHTDEMLVEKINYAPRRIAALIGIGGSADAMKPVLKGDDVCAWYCKRVGKHSYHLVPGLPLWVLDVVDGTGIGVGEEQVA